MRDQASSPLFWLIAIALTLGGCASDPPPDPTVGHLVCPGEGYGPVRLGMSPEEVVAVLGQPKLKISPTAYQYAEGFAVVFDRRFRVASVMCGGFCEGDKPLVERVGGRTASGIGMGSSTDMVRQCYGDPEKTRTIADDPKLLILEYPKLGAAFTFRNDRLVHITISKAQAPR